MTSFPIIDLKATGKNISRLRRSSGLSVREIQGALGLTAPQAIYKWQRGQTLPSVDNLYALSAILQVPMDEILVPVKADLNTDTAERQGRPCRSVRFGYIWYQHPC